MKTLSLILAFAAALPAAAIEPDQDCVNGGKEFLRLAKAGAHREVAVPQAQESDFHRRDGRGGGDLRDARIELEKLIRDLQSLQDLALPHQRHQIQRALESARAALDVVNRYDGPGRDGRDRDGRGRHGGRIERSIDEARALQTLITAMFERDTMWGKELHDREVEVVVDQTPAMREVLERFPSFKGSNGKVKLGGDQVGSQYMTLRNAFYAALQDAAAADNTDRRIKGLADWGVGTKVTYRGNPWGTQILSGDDYNNLGLR